MDLTSEKHAGEHTKDTKKSKSFADRGQSAMRLRLRPESSQSQYTLFQNCIFSCLITRQIQTLRKQQSVFAAKAIVSPRTSSTNSAASTDAAVRCKAERTKQDGTRPFSTRSEAQSVPKIVLPGGSAAQSVPRSCSHEREKPNRYRDHAVTRVEPNWYQDHAVTGPPQRVRLEAGCTRY
eukprot:1755953-Rhodomonas_salina.2